jgi:hypothetical protein
MPAVSAARQLLPGRRAAGRAACRAGRCRCRDPRRPRRADTSAWCAAHGEPRPGGRRGVLGPCAGHVVRRRSHRTGASAHRCRAPAILSPAETFGVIWSHLRNSMSELALCGADMPPRAARWCDIQPKSGTDKGICAGHVVDTTPDNVSTPQLESQVNYRGDTSKTTPDNRQVQFHYAQGTILDHSVWWQFCWRLGRPSGRCWWPTQIGKASLARCHVLPFDGR